MYKVIRKIFSLEVLAQIHNISSNILLSCAVYQKAHSAIKSCVRAKQTSFANWSR
jgi:hypothetical protein